MRLGLLLMRLRRAFGVHDLVDVRDATGARRIGHVRAWLCAGRLYRTGDAVPHFDGWSTYSLQTLEGWWVNIVNGRLVDWSVKPIHPAVTMSRWRRRGPRGRVTVLG